MVSQVSIAHPLPAGRPVHHALGDGLRAALINDPVGLILVPLVLHFPNMVLEALQARFAGGLEQELAHNPLIGPALSLGWGFALAGRLLGQALIIRRVAARLTEGRARTLGEEFEGVFSRFPVFIATFLLFWAAFLSGFVVFVLPGLLALYLWGFASQVVALEPVGILGAFRRSRAVVAGQTGRWLVGAALAVAGLAAAAAGAGLVWAGIAEGYGGDVPFGIYIVAFGVVEFVAVLFASVWTAFYLDLERSRHLRASRDTGPAIVPPPSAEDEVAGEASRAG